MLLDLSTGNLGTVVRLASCGTNETAGSSLPRDEVLADHLRDLSLKCDGELVALNAFDLAIAEHGMMHGITDRECRRGDNRWRRLGIVVSPWFLLWLGFRLDHGARRGVETDTISVAGKGR